MKDIQRFIKFIIKNGDCWEWQGSLDKDGYGWFHFSSKLTKAHRASYKMFKHDITSLQHLDHLCRNRKCVNPEHLEIVTPRENTLRSPIAPAAVNSRKTHCYKGHKLSGKNLVIIKSTGERRCRTCTNINKKLRRDKIRAKRIATGEVITKGPKPQEKCNRGHEYSFTPKGLKVCLPCSRAKTARYRQKKRIALI